MDKLKRLLQNRNIKIIAAAILAVIVIIPLWLGANHNNIGQKETKKVKKDVFAHTEQAIVREEEYEGLKFTNISMITEKGYTTFTTDVTNTTNEEINIENVDIVLQDKDGNTVITLLGNIGGSLKSNETKTITASAKGEFTNVKAKAIKGHE